MSLVNKPYTFSAGATIVAAEHNSNFDTIYNEFNGSITNANVSSSAAITDSKLAQLTTAGKVSGASFTLLGSIPSGGGVVPIANLATGTPDGTKFIRDDGTLQLPAVVSATQAQQEAASSTTVSSTPGNQQYHPSACKAWAIFDGTTTGTHAVTAGYNVASVTRNSAGNYTVTFTTAFSSANYCVTYGLNRDGSTAGIASVFSLASGSFVIKTEDGSFSPVDYTAIHVTCFGDQ